MTETKYTAIVLRGRLKGQRIELHQWCNDWATDIAGKVHSLGNLVLDIPTWLKFKDMFDQDRKENTSKRMGQMFWFYYDYEHFMLTRRFKRIKRQPL